MKFIEKIKENILFVLTLLLLAFIPLYPKIPLLDIRNTWVYIRVEDFLVVFVLIIWAILLLKRKITLRTPLTLPILVFWLVGALSTIHGVLLIFPTLANVFPNVAFLSFVRRIEYLSLFFVAFAGIKDKKNLYYLIAVISITLLLVIGYGIGQRYMGFPAYLTMNEEFAKGEPITLSRQSRVPSTFAGHYDLAAYLVLILPIIASLFFGVKKWIMKLIFVITLGLGFLLMFMTVSRVSFFVLLVALGIVLFFQKKKAIILALPLVFIFPVILLSFTPALLTRFGSTINEVDVLIDANTGEPIGHAKQVPSDYFKDKIIIQDYILKESKVEGVSIFREEEELFQKSSSVLATISANLSTPSAGIISFYNLPKEVTLLVPTNVSNGENLPQGTGYINLSLSPVTKKIGEYFYERENPQNESGAADVVIINGNFLVKRAAAYDLSFTTRFQGEWPHALEAFMRNIIFGSGYGSISLAIDNNYLRILGEIGLLGITSFIAIFLAIAIYIRKVLPHVHTPILRSFILGFCAGVIGLALNAVFIDVFEASKVAFVLWLLTGSTLGILHLYQRENVNISAELKKTAFSTPAIIVYLLILTIFLYSPMLNNYFVGDDFTWFHWAAENNNILRFFTSADGFFYRPGMKLYFYIMYKFFWLNQTVYHGVSILLHFLVTSLVFILAKRILKNVYWAGLAAFFFLFISGYSEAVFWISSFGHLMTTLCIILSLLFYQNWLNNRKLYNYILSILFVCFGLLFHELGIITPILLLAFKFIQDRKISFSKINLADFMLVVPIVIYLLIRFLSGSHWYGGDYSYNLLKFPYNSIGNSIGYLMLSLMGPMSLSIYNSLREILKGNLIIINILSILLIAALYIVLPKLKKAALKLDIAIILKGLIIFFVGLLPFLGLGNIASRYNYLATVGVVIIITYIVNILFNYLKSYGKDNALASILVVMTVFILLHLMQFQQVHSDWNTAGKKAERFLIAIDEVYADYWAKEPMTFYFINVPIKTGQAWIFPVGLKDALWFSFRNTNITINNYSSVDEALSLINKPRNEKVFEFDSSGKLKEYRKRSYGP